MRETITQAGIAGITVRGLMQALGLSEACVRGHVAALRREGFLSEDTIQAGGSDPGRPTKLLIDRRFR